MNTTHSDAGETTKAGGVSWLVIAIPVLVVVLLLSCVLCVCLRCHIISMRPKPRRRSSVPARTELLRDFFNISRDRDRVFVIRSQRASGLFSAPRAHPPRDAASDAPQTTGTNTSS